MRLEPVRFSRTSVRRGPRHRASLGSIASVGPSWHVGLTPSRPGEFHPEPLTEPDLILSHHPARATAGRLPPSAEIEAPPLASWLRLAHSDYGGPPPSLHGHYTRFIATTRRSAPARRIGTFGLTVVAACTFSLGIAEQVLTFHVRARMRVTPPAHRTPQGQ
jgi:hypothetical protein